MLDFGAETATVLGLGGVTVRVAGRSTVLQTGTSVSIDELREMAVRLGREVPPAPSGDSGRRATSDQPADSGLPGDSGMPYDATMAGATASGPRSGSPLLDEVHDQELRFEAAVAAGDPSEAVRAVLATETVLVAWSRDTAGTDEVDRARSVLQALIVRLGDLGGASSSTVAERLRPLVELLVAARSRARVDRDFALADIIRDGLLAAGVELHDAPAGTTWELLDAEPPADEGNPDTSA